MKSNLSFYYCYSSHNTYLSGNQLTGDSTAEMYRLALEMGCRCVELDLWDGPGDEPKITHGFTMTSELSLRSALKTIKESAFKVSPYPVILSLEMHCKKP
jgi:hypothetical protein